MWFLAAAICTKVPTSGEPVKDRKSMPACALNAAPATSPAPDTRLIAPAGKPTSMARAARRMGVRQASSAGFSTVAFPIARAGAKVRPNICAG